MTPSVEAAWAVGVAAAAVGLEALLLWIGWAPYFQLGFALTPDLLPIDRIPEGEGRTASTRWTADGGVVRFTAGRDGLIGLHGVVLCDPVRPGRVGLRVRWAPPMSALLGILLLVSLAAGTPAHLAAIPLALVLTVVIGVAYHKAAVRAAAELRWSFLRSGGDEDDVLP